MVSLHWESVVCGLLTGRDRIHTLRRRQIAFDFAVFVTVWRPTSVHMTLDYNRACGGWVRCDEQKKNAPGGAFEDALASRTLRGRKSTYCDLWAIVARIHYLILYRCVAILSTGKGSFHGKRTLESRTCWVWIWEFSRSGWAVIDLDDDGRPCGVRRSGVRCFDSGVGSETEIASGKDESQNIKRRQARQQRRQLWRRGRRLKKVFHLLQKAGLLPPDEARTPQQRHELLYKLDAELAKKLHSRRGPRRRPPLAVSAALPGARSIAAAVRLRSGVVSFGPAARVLRQQPVRRQERQGDRAGQGGHR